MNGFRMALLAGALTVIAVSPAAAAGLTVVAAENFYGDLAKQVGGKAVTVTSILSNPDQDPHLFEADPSTARALKSAKVVVSNGIDYDPWMEKLTAADPSPGRAEIVAADLMGKKTGDNPAPLVRPEDHGNGGRGHGREVRRRGSCGKGRVQEERGRLSTRR